MARGGKQKGAGRKPIGSRRVAMLIRVGPEVRARLERDAKRAGHSLSREAEHLLEDALAVAPSADQQTRALAYLVQQIVGVGRSIERSDAPEFNWRENRFDFEALKCALALLMDRLAPPGGAGSSRYPLAQSPREMGRILASIVLAFLASGDKGLPSIGDRRGSTRGSLFYAYPQAARALGLSKVDLR
jgi:hypothetical protein